MTKDDITFELAQKTDLNQIQAKEALAAILREMKKALVRKEQVILRGFGTFSLLKKQARMGRNPKTGEPALITARTVVTFKAGGKLYDSVLMGA